MNKSEKIRSLYSQGMTTSEIATKLGVRYQFAYGVISKTKKPQNKVKKAKNSPTAKPKLTTQRLLDGGFVLTSRWKISASGVLYLDGQLPKNAGVYAFAKNGIVQYVGVSTKTLAWRCNFYIKPGVSQRTSQRLNKILFKELNNEPHIEVYTISVSDHLWNGWHMDGNLGLEGGIIYKFDLPWNMRGASPFVLEKP
jgi:hypothetical protein